ncbi:MAG: tetratricopeptide repeat protein [Bacteriovorax sp.]|jgi:tetratricopeptide (TPR) repeat protein
MSKDNKLQLLSPLFLKYQTDFEKNPRSRVFAPLAETYRKLGMTDKAMEILSEGIRYNPSYVMGYLGLAFCYFDLKQFNLAYSTLRPLIESNRDNLRLQKLFSEVCLELGKQEEALETLKYLLFINPRDKDVAESVARLEREVEDRYKPQHKPIIIPEKELTSESHDDNSLHFNIDKLDTSKKSESNDFDDWMAIDLSTESKSKGKNNQEISSTTNFDQWNVRKGDQSLQAPVQTTNVNKIEPLVDLNFRKEVPEESVKEDNAPLVTHTLVDLYCGQGHIEKALEVLEKILLLNPNDQKTVKKIKEIQALVQPLNQYDELPQKQIVPEAEEIAVSDFSADFTTQTQKQDMNPAPFVDLSDLDEISEEDGRRRLMSLIDKKLGPLEIELPDESKAETVRLVEKKLSLFLKKIQKRALDYQSRV